MILTLTDNLTRLLTACQVQRGHILMPLRLRLHLVLLSRVLNSIRRPGKTVETRILEEQWSSHIHTTAHYLQRRCINRCSVVRFLSCWLQGHYLCLFLWCWLSLESSRSAYTQPPFRVRLWWDYSLWDFSCLDACDFMWLFCNSNNDNWHIFPVLC